MKLAEHFKKLIGWIKSIGGEHQEIQVRTKSQWDGLFVKVDDQFAVQNVGRKYVIHILGALDKKPLEGSKSNVLYGFDGKAKVTIQPDLNLVKGKGGIAAKHQVASLRSKRQKSAMDKLPGRFRYQAPFRFLLGSLLLTKRCQAIAHLKILYVSSALH